MHFVLILLHFPSNLKNPGCTSHQIFAQTNKKSKKENIFGPAVKKCEHCIVGKMIEFAFKLFLQCIYVSVCLHFYQAT